MRGHALLIVLAAAVATVAIATDSVIWPMSPQDGRPSPRSTFGLRSLSCIGI